VLAQWRLDPARVRFIHEAAGSLFRPTGGDPAGAEALAALGLAPDTRYLLYVGGISPHKNLSLLIDAFCALTAEAAFAGTKLLLVGDIEKDVFHSSLSEHREALRAKERGSDVVFTGFVPDAALVHLYNRSTALVLPSLDEGFGLPAIEAMACGTPVVASRAGSLPEVVGDAGLLFDPRDGEDLVARLRVVLGDPAVRAALSRQCLERAAGFSWAHAAGELRGIFEELHGR
jgi:glycosyltransferase involved in cell wall biosynthesis